MVCNAQVIIPDSTYKKLIHRIELEKYKFTLLNLNVKNLDSIISNKDYILTQYKIRDSTFQVNNNILLDSLILSNKKISDLQDRLEITFFSVIGLIALSIILIIF